MKLVSWFVNKPDHHSVYPLHAALQRLRRYETTSRWTEDSPLEAIVHDLLDAGADPTVLDGGGNTALHCLADNGLAEQWRSEAARTLCAHFCDRGVDVNGRNKLGRTALEILVDDSGCIQNRRWTQHPMEQHSPSTLEEVDGEVFGIFVEGGRAVDGAGSQGTHAAALGRDTCHG